LTSAGALHAHVIATELGLDLAIADIWTKPPLSADLTMDLKLETALIDAFAVVNEVLRQGVAGISEIITVPGLINVDFADVKAIMRDAGSALMGIGEGKGENRAIDAAKMAVSSPLLELSIDGAKGVLFIITGGPDITMTEVNDAAKIVTGEVDPNAKVIFGTVINENMKDLVKITVIATGFGMSTQERSVHAPARQQSIPREGREPQSVREQQRQQQTYSEQEIVLPKTKEEEELEIPAFIRKKMG